MKNLSMKLTSHLLPLIELALAATAILNSPIPLWAQSGANSGQIVGQILDPSAGAVSGAAVSVRNRDTNFTRSTSTDRAGRYAVSDLPLGQYEVSAQASGFQTSAQLAAVT